MACCYDAGRRAINRRSFSKRMSADSRTHARLCGMHAGSTGQAACPLYDATAIHRLTGTTPCVCFAAVRARGVLFAEHREGEMRGEGKQECEGQNVLMPPPSRVFLAAVLWWFVGGSHDGQQQRHPWFLAWPG
jgi:hypothetical protein